ncbi:TrkH family potassium uptake protein [Hathewaya massiliensis]|uniref:TrkH family potassium uptake protein n=1 Tax=Hathewaya massiliensis TaxID=1964382 RepID=UPI0011596C30|nr:potassium transporter TrkG [Hathewaya massiliensis]
MQISREWSNDVNTILYYVGYAILATTSLMILPIITSLFYKEWIVIIDFLISLSISLIIGILFILIGKKHNENFQWKHGLIIASLTWAMLTALCAIPYFLSGHTSNSFLDAVFDVMSGLTTTGLVLTQNLDHLSRGLNMWRHILTFVGGQGMIVLILCFFAKNMNGAYKMYVGEAKDIELLPNTKNTARLIWLISIIYLIIGTICFFIAGLVIGLKPSTAFLHGMYIFMSAWSTGGFGPMSQNLMYYHSFLYENLSIIFFIIGSFNFGLHYAMWKGNKKEIFKNIETRSFFITATLFSALLITGMQKLGYYKNATSIFRRGVYNLLSAHTTTGFANIYARQFALDYGDFGILIMVIVMLIGGSACSTAGGIKGLRLGVIAKGIIADIKTNISSERRVKVFKFHNIKDYVLEDGLVKSAAIIAFCYLVLFGVGTLIGTYYGYPLSSAAFESASATGNVGLSIGVTAPTMPSALKIFYIIAMYLGRLEFVSVFALMGFICGGVKKLCLKYLGH